MRPTFKDVIYWPERYVFKASLRTETFTEQNPTTHVMLEQNPTTIVMLEQNPTTNIMVEQNPTTNTPW